MDVGCVDICGLCICFPIEDVLVLYYAFAFVVRCLIIGWWSALWLLSNTVQSASLGQTRASTPLLLTCCTT